LKNAIIALTIACFAFRAMPVSAVEGGANLALTVYSCLKDADEAPIITLQARPYGPTADKKVVPSNASLIEPHVWLLAATVPKGHWYVELRTPHCAGFFETTSVDGEKREFLTATLPETSGPLYDVSGFLAGSLPFAGKVDNISLSSVPASAECSSGNSRSPVIGGRYFYYDELLTGDYCLTIYVARGYNITRRIHVSRDGIVVQITSAEIESVLYKYQ
jgi:hypothetical protein